MTNKMFFDLRMVTLVTPVTCLRPSFDIACKKLNLFLKNVIDNYKERQLLKTGQVKLVTFRAFFSLRLCLALLTGSSSISAAAASCGRFIPIQCQQVQTQLIKSAKLVTGFKFLFSGQKGWLQYAQKNESHCVNHHRRVTDQKHLTELVDVVMSCLFGLKATVKTIFNVRLNTHLSLLCLCLCRVLFLQVRDRVIAV